MQGRDFADVPFLGDGGGFGGLTSRAGAEGASFGPRRRSARVCEDRDSLLKPRPSRSLSAFLRLLCHSAGCEVIKVSPQRAAADHVRRKCLQRIVLTEPTRTRKLAAQGGDLARTRMTDKCLCEALTKHLQHVFREDPRTWDPQS